MGGKSPPYPPRRHHRVSPSTVTSSNNCATGVKNPKIIKYPITIDKIKIILENKLAKYGKQTGEQI